MKQPEELKHDEKPLEQGNRKKYHYSLDGVKLETSQPTVTGAEVRGQLPPEKAGYPIFLEEHGNNPDRQITDAETFSLEKQPPSFYSTPPATFGLL